MMKRTGINGAIIRQFMSTSHPNQIDTNRASQLRVYGWPDCRPAAAEHAVGKPPSLTHPKRGLVGFVCRRRAVYSHFTADGPAVWR